MTNGLPSLDQTQAKFTLSSLQRSTEAPTPSAVGMEETETADSCDRLMIAHPGTLLHSVRVHGRPKLKSITDFGGSRETNDVAECPFSAYFRKFQSLGRCQSRSSSRYRDTQQGQASLVHLHYHVPTPFSPTYTNCNSSSPPSSAQWALDRRPAPWQRLSRTPLCQRRGRRPAHFAPRPK